VQVGSNSKHFSLFGHIESVEDALDVKVPLAASP